MVWENVFGWWNPWNDADRLLLKKTSAILRAYEAFFRDPDWEPYVATGTPGVYAMEWHQDGAVLYTLYNAGEREQEAALHLPEGAPPELVDVWNGKEIRAADGKNIRYSLGPGALGCVAAGGPARILSFPAEAGQSRRHQPVTLAAYEARPVPWRNAAASSWAWVRA